MKKFIVLYGLSVLVFCFSIHTFANQALRIFGEDGTTIHVRYFEAAGPQAALLVVPGLQSHSDWYIAAGESLQKRGISSLVFDRRGTGRSSGMRGHANNPEELLRDIETARAFLRKMVPNVPMHMLANSLGFITGTVFLAKNSEKFQTLILSTPSVAIRNQADYSWFRKLHIFTSPSKEYFETPLRDEYFVSEGPWLDWVKGDRLGQRNFTAGFLRSINTLKTEAIDTHSTLLKPLLFLLASKDAIIDNKEAVEKYYSPYFGPKELKEFDAEHFLGFSAEHGAVEEVVAAWILDH